MNIPNSHVYFGSCHTVDDVDMGVVKVGISHHPSQRVKMVSTTEPFVCRLICFTPGDLFLENFCHMWLRNDHVSGEYFRNSKEVQRLIGSIKDSGKLPFSIEYVEPEGMFMNLDLSGYMDRVGITLDDVQKQTGLSSQYHKKVLLKQRSGSRRLLAAVAVTAVRKGLTVHWARDFKPISAERAAA